jgi:peroxiredoxin
MQVAGLIIRFVLAGVFCAAAVGKAIDPRGSRDAARNFGVPSALAPVVAVVLPMVEAAVAVALVPGSFAVVGAAAALALLTTFSVASGIALRQGRRPDCHCFGQLHNAPIGAGTFIRNAALAAAAIVVVRAGGGESAPTWWRGLGSAGRMGVTVGAVFGTLALAEAAVSWNLFVRYGQLLVRIDDLAGSSGVPPAARLAPAPGSGLPIGTEAPAFALRGVHGETSTLAALRARGRPMLVLFTDPHCGPCGALTPEIASWQQAYESRFTLAVVSRGSDSDNLAKFVAAGVSGVLVQDDREVSAAYQSPATPSAVFIDAAGRIASEAAIGADAIRRLVATVGGVPAVPVAFGNGNGNGNGHQHPAPAPQLRIGDPAPDVRLPDLDGRTVELTSFRGRPVLAVFWNPSCGYCNDLLPQLQEWEARRSHDAPEPLIITTGPVEANRALGFRSTVLLDTPFAVGPRFGANGTPMAVVVDPAGHIASDLAIGGPAVMELAARVFV